MLSTHILEPSPSSGFPHIHSPINNLFFLFNKQNYSCKLGCV